MAELGARIVETFVSEWDLSGKQYRAVKVGSADNKIICGSQTNDAGVFGLLLNKPTSGEAARVAILGFAKGQAGDTVTRGNYLGSNATGFLIPIVSSFSNVVCQAMASATSGSVVNVLVSGQMRAA